MVEHLQGLGLDLYAVPKKTFLFQNKFLTERGAASAVETRTGLHETAAKDCPRPTLYNFTAQRMRTIKGIMGLSDLPGLLHSLRKCRATTVSVEGMMELTGQTEQTVTGHYKNLNQAFRSMTLHEAAFAKVHAIITSSETVDDPVGEEFPTIPDLDYVLVR